MEHECYLCKRPIRKCGRLYRAVIKGRLYYSKYNPSDNYSRGVRNVRRICKDCKDKLKRSYNEENQ